ncbi:MULTISPECIES: DUF2200 domain-containing protein [unclassified Brevundimonas]|uniref:DUF2200 domain-containing protein n=1 Tax=unclassified Brevundimonas TaxID=2622653 RepID=UPI003F913F5A
MVAGSERSVKICSQPQSWTDPVSPSVEISIRGRKGEERRCVGLEWRPFSMLVQKAVPCRQMLETRPLGAIIGSRPRENDAGALATRHAETIIMTKHRIYTTSFASVYPHYVAKAEKKGRTKAEVDQIICWLTGFSEGEMNAHLEKRTDFETFFAEASEPNPARAKIMGVICGVRVENIDEPLMREIRYLDKLIDELAKGKAIEKILRE